MTEQLSMVLQNPDVETVEGLLIQALQNYLAQFHR